MLALVCTDLLSVAGITLVLRALSASKGLNTRLYCTLHRHWLGGHRPVDQHRHSLLIVAGGHLAGGLAAAAGQVRSGHGHRSPADPGPRHLGNADRGRHAGPRRPLQNPRRRRRRVTTCCRCGLNRRLQSHHHAHYRESCDDAGQIPFCRRLFSCTNERSLGLGRHAGTPAGVGCFKAYLEYCLKS